MPPSVLKIVLERLNRGPDSGLKLTVLKVDGPSKVDGLSQIGRSFNGK